MSVFLIDFENVTSAGLAGIDKLTENDSVYIFYTPNAASLSFDAHRTIISAKPRISYICVSAGVKNALDFQLDSFLGYLTAVSKDRSFYIVSSDSGYSAVKSFWEKNMNMCDIQIRIIPCIRYIFRQNIIGTSVLPVKDAVMPNLSEPEIKEAVPSEPAASSNEADSVQEASGEKSISSPKRSEGKPSEKKPDKKTALSPDIERLILIFKAEGISNDAGKAIFSLAKSSSDKQHFYTSMTKKFGMEEGLRFYKALRPEYANIRKLSPKAFNSIHN